MKTATWMASTLLALACNNNSPPDGGPATCPSPGQATPGPADNHCAGQPVQPVSAAVCFADAGPADAGPDDAGSTCPWGATMFGQSADDDDCKYHVSWTSTEICEGAVTFTVTVTNLADGSPVTGIPRGIVIEQYIPSVPDASCDQLTTHPGPNIGSVLVETPVGSGTYTGPVQFNAPGDWTLRFHIHEECTDFYPSSPHGHAAFHINVP